MSTRLAAKQKGLSWQEFTILGGIKFESGQETQEGKMLKRRNTPDKRKICKTVIRGSHSNQ